MLPDKELIINVVYVFCTWTVVFVEQQGLRYAAVFKE